MRNTGPVRGGYRAIYVNQLLDQANAAGGVECLPHEQKMLLVAASRDPGEFHARAGRIIADTNRIVAAGRRAGPTSYECAARDYRRSVNRVAAALDRLGRA